MSVSVVFCSCHREPPPFAQSPRSYVCARAREMDVEPELLLSSARTAYLVHVRTIIATELRGMGYSFPEIGRAINRHHTSVMNLLSELS